MSSAQKSIFDLPRSNEFGEPQLSKLQYVQVAPLREVGGTSFPNGDINYRFSVGSNEWWMPARSYIRTRGTFNVVESVGPVVTRQIALNDGIAPSMNLMANILRGGALKLQNKEISKIEDFMPHISALYTRMTKSGAWLDGIGSSISYWNADYTERLNKLTVDGASESRTVSKAELGFTAATTIAYDNTAGAAERLVTFSAVPYTNINKTLDIGDIINFNNGQNGVVETFVDALNVTIGPTALGADIAASAVQFNVVKKTPSTRAVSFELIWQPPLSVWKLGTALPVGDYELTLTPESASIYQMRAIESLVAKTPGVVAAGDFNFSITNMFLYIAQMKGQRISNRTYYLDLDEIALIPDDITAGSNLKTFSVEPNTNALTVAFQDTASGTNTVLSPAKFTVANSDELKLYELQVKYGGYEKPENISDFRFDSTVTFADGLPKDWFQQRYVDTYMYTGRYFEDAGPESFDDWVTRGPFYHFPFPVDAGLQDTNARVRYNFSGAGSTLKMLLFEHYKKTLRVTITDDRVTGVDFME